jgi:hypothetical protein
MLPAQVRAVRYVYALCTHYLHYHVYHTYSAVLVGAS